VMGGKTYLSHETALENRPATAKAAQEQEILGRLTPRQRQILILIAEGKSTKEIAGSLNISGKTVESHRAQLSERLDIHDVAGLVRFAIKTNLINVE